jgi:hypothetical protein
MFPTLFTEYRSNHILLRFVREEADVRENNSLHNNPVIWEALGRFSSVRMFGDFLGASRQNVFIASFYYTVSPLQDYKYNLCTLT